jgi:pimeloyl-ACP methyl ester carboxylesterase
MTDASQPLWPRLRITMVTTHVKAAVLVLPGGKPSSQEPSRALQLANLRIDLLTKSLRRRLGADVEVRQVRYRLRGWNPGSLDAVRDATVALDALLDTVGEAPVVVVGHSMGGRVAAHLAAERRVAAVAALAPWWPSNDADLIPPSSRLLTMHGTADTWTDPTASRAQTLRAASRGVDATWVDFPGAGHFLLRDYSRWHRLTAEFAIAQWSERSQA